MRFTIDVCLAAPQSALFAFLGDPANRLRWQSSLLEVEYEPDGPPRVGTRWRERARGLGTFDMEITEYEAPVRWAEKIESRRARGTIALQFAEDGQAATRLTVAVDVSLRGIFRLAGPVAAWLMRREMRRDLEQAARIVAGKERPGSKAS